MDGVCARRIFEQEETIWRLSSPEIRITAIPDAPFGVEQAQKAFAIFPSEFAI